jgi:uncharacterized membrane protein YeaQ/YmgE (transglycosylase-associated protein family)
MTVHEIDTRGEQAEKGLTAANAAQEPASPLFAQNDTQDLRTRWEKILQPTKTHPVLGVLALCSATATSAYGRAFSTPTGNSMSMFSLIILGLIAGFIGSKIVNRRGEGILLDILLGVVGAFVGGWLFQLFGRHGVSGLNVYSLFVAVIGSAAVLVLYHAVFRRRSWFG